MSNKQSSTPVAAISKLEPGGDRSPAVVKNVVGRAAPKINQDYVRIIYIYITATAIIRQLNSIEMGSSPVFACREYLKA
jgi:hypothetical protein